MKYGRFLRFVFSLYLPTYRLFIAHHRPTTSSGIPPIRILPRPHTPIHPGTSSTNSYHTTSPTSTSSSLSSTDRRLNVPSQRGCTSLIAGSVRCCCWYVPMGPSIVTIRGSCYPVMLMRPVQMCIREGQRGGGGLSRLMCLERRCLRRRRFMSFRCMRYVQSRLIPLHIPHFRCLLSLVNSFSLGCPFFRYTSSMSYLRREPNYQMEHGHT